MTDLLTPPPLTKTNSIITDSKTVQKFVFTGGPTVPFDIAAGTDWTFDATGNALGENVWKKFDVAQARLKNNLRK